MHPYCRCSTAAYEDSKEYEAWLHYLDQGGTTEEWNRLNESSTKSFKSASGKYAKAAANTTKNIDLDDMHTMTYGKDIDDKIVETIYNTLNPGERNGEYYISDVVFKPLEGKALMQIAPIPSGRRSLLELHVNTDMTTGVSLDELDARIKASGLSVTNSLEEAAIHESGHAKLIKGKGIKEIAALYDELSGRGIDGISKIALDDGVEAIAEIEVLIARGDTLSEEAKKLYDTYMK